MAAPALTDFVLYTATPLTDANYEFNWDVVVGYFTDGTWDVSFNDLTAAGTTTLADLETTGTVTMIGVVDGSSATAGDVGEYIEDIESTGVSITSDGVFHNIANITLTAGDWDISAGASLSPNGGTFSYWDMAISKYSGNTTTDHVIGNNRLEMFGTTSTTYLSSAAIANYRVSITGSTVYYLKILTTTVGALAIGYGRISARRVR